MKIHKFSHLIKTDFLCGRRSGLATDIDRVAFKWREVTCKKCLKKRVRGKKS